MATESEPASVRALYSVMQSIESRLGGGEGVEGMYGSISKAGMHKILTCMRDHCGMDASSQVVDIGAGLGRPLLHALLHPGVRAAYGIELDRIKCEKAEAFVQQTLGELLRRSELGGVGRGGDLCNDVAGDGHDAEGRAIVEPPPVLCTAIERVLSLDPATHAYSFWEGVPRQGKAAFGRLFARSATLQSVAVVQRAVRSVPPAGMMAELGFGPLRLSATFPVAMSGSGRSFRAYIFVRAGPAPLATLVPSADAPVAAAIAASSRDTVYSAEEDGSCATALPPSLTAALQDGAEEQQQQPGKQAVVELCSRHTVETLTGVPEAPRPSLYMDDAGEGGSSAAGERKLRPRRSQRITEWLVPQRRAVSAGTAKNAAASTATQLPTQQAAPVAGAAAAAAAPKRGGAPRGGSRRSPTKRPSPTKKATAAAAPKCKQATLDDAAIPLRRQRQPRGGESKTTAAKGLDFATGATARTALAANGRRATTATAPAKGAAGAPPAHGLHGRRDAIVDA